LNLEHGKGSLVFWILNLHWGLKSNESKNNSSNRIEKGVRDNGRYGKHKMTPKIRGIKKAFERCFN
jgi:hypothetical protein